MFSKSSSSTLTTGSQEKKSTSTGEHGVFSVVILDKRIKEEDMAPLLLGLSKLKENVFCAVYSYMMVPGEVHLLIREKEQSVAGCVEYLHENCFGDSDFTFTYEPIIGPDGFVEAFARMARLPVDRGLCAATGEWAYGSWVNEYQGMCSIKVCNRLIVLRRFGFDSLYKAVNP